MSLIMSMRYLNNACIYHHVYHHVTSSFSLASFIKVMDLNFLVLTKFLVAYDYRYEEQ